MLTPPPVDQCARIIGPGDDDVHGINISGFTLARSFLPISSVLVRGLQISCVVCNFVRKKYYDDVVLCVCRLVCVKHNERLGGRHKIEGPT